MLFAIALPRTPKSLQADGVQKYKEAIRQAAVARIATGPTDKDWLYVRIIRFAWKKGGPDIDNIIKPLLDALKGVAYRDDKQILQCLSTRIDLRKPYSVASDNIPSNLYQELTDRINARQSDVLYVEVGTCNSQRAVFGSIDGGAYDQALSKSRRGSHQCQRYRIP